MPVRTTISFLDLARGWRPMTACAFLGLIFMLLSEDLLAMDSQTQRNFRFWAKSEMGSFAIFFCRLCCHILFVTTINRVLANKRLHVRERSYFLHCGSRFVFGPLLPTILVETSSVDLFDTIYVQAIVNHKWNKYAAGPAF